MNYIITMNQYQSISTPWGRQLPMSCLVRNELLPAPFLRGMDEVVYTEPPAKSGPPVPYMPRLFPVGTWSIWGIDSKDSKGNPLGPYEAPFFISTSARQLVDEWEVVQHEKLWYVRKTGRKVWDSGYGCHTSTSITTLGCGRIGPALALNDTESIREEKLAEGVEHITWLANQLSTAFSDGDTMQLEVMA